MSAPDRQPSERQPSDQGPSDQGLSERGLRVRLLEQRDTEAVREILKQHQAVTVFRDQPFSDWKLNEHFKKALSRPPRMVAPVALLLASPVQTVGFDGATF